MTASRRLALATALGGAVLTLITVGTPLAASGAPNGAPSPTYVALGDSFASGVGTRAYYDDGSGCQRSPYAYPVLDAARIGATLTFAACSGASTSDVRNSQLAGLDGATRWVTVTVGGNDAGFSSVLTECAQPWWSSDCNGAIDQARAVIRNLLPGRLDQVYAAIAQRAPSARTVVVGYPRLFNGEDCNAGTWFSPSEMQRLNDTADLLNATTRARATAAGFDHVDPTTAFLGHAVCSDTEWINGLSHPVNESYHPNRTGQQGYADVVDDVLLS